MNHHSDISICIDPIVIHVSTELDIEETSDRLRELLNDSPGFTRALTALVELALQDPALAGVSVDRPGPVWIEV